MQQDPLRRRTRRTLVRCCLLGLCISAAAASGCRSPSRRHLTPAVHGSAPRADYGAGLAIVKADAALATMLGETRYRVIDQGPFEGRRSAPGARPDLVGVAFRLQLARPTTVDARVPSVTGPWPRGSRSFDPAASYVEFESRITGTVADLTVLVDLRSRAVVGISPGSPSHDADVTQLTDPALLPHVDPTPE
jgi:hypothetical protein